MTERGIAPPIQWFGGKSKWVGWLLPLVPEHAVYVEPFGGAAALLFAKPPAPLEVYNDIDSGLVNLYRVLRDPEKFERFLRLAALTPYSREECDYLSRTWDESQDDVERAWGFFVVARMSFAGSFGHGWSNSVTHSRRGMAGAVSRYLSAIERLPEVHERLKRVQIEHGDFRHVIEAYDSEETFFYVDPPYIHATRGGVRYRYEMTDDDHRDLVELLLGIKGKAMLSGYQHPVYEPLEAAGWQRVDRDVACWSVGRTRITGLLGPGATSEEHRRVESVWMNYTKEPTLWDAS